MNFRTSCYSFLYSRFYIRFSIHGNIFYLFTFFLLFNARQPTAYYKMPFCLCFQQNMENFPQTNSNAFQKKIHFLLEWIQLLKKFGKKYSHVLCIYAAFSSKRVTLCEWKPYYIFTSLDKKKIYIFFVYRIRSRKDFAIYKQSHKNIHRL